MVTRHFATYTRVQASEAELGGFGLVNGDNSSRMTRTEDVRRLLPDAPDAPECAQSAMTLL